MSDELAALRKERDDAAALYWKAYHAYVGGPVDADDEERRRRMHEAREDLDVRIAAVKRAELRALREAK